MCRLLIYLNQSTSILFTQYLKDKPKILHTSTCLQPYNFAARCLLGGISIRLMCYLPIMKAYRTL